MLCVDCAYLSGPNDRIIFDVFILFFIYVIPGSVVIYSYSVTGCRLLTDQLSALRHEGGAAPSPPPLPLVTSATPVTLTLPLAAMTTSGKQRLTSFADARPATGGSSTVLHALQCCGRSSERLCRCRRGANEPRRPTSRSSVSNWQLLQPC